MVTGFSCTIVCPPPAVSSPDTDPFNDAFSFRAAQAAARGRAEAWLGLAHQAAAAGADLIVLPEDIHGIRHFWRVLDSPNMLRRLAEPIPGPTTAAAAAIARASRSHLAVTLYENHGSHVYNTTVLVGSKGKVLTVYRKTHLASGEDWLVEPGDTLSVVATPLGRIGFACGEDYLVPEVACALARLNAAIVICPSRCPQDEGIVCTRSREFGMITLVAQPDQSLCIDQWGSTLARSAGRRSYLLATTFSLPGGPAPTDRAELDALLTGTADERQRRSGRRRPKLYGVLAAPSWPECATLSPRDEAGRRLVAYQKLSGPWETGPHPLPPWEC